MSGALTREQLERLFARGTISRGQFVAALAALGLSVPTLEALLGRGRTVAEAAPLQARYLVLIVLDAFRPDYLSLAPMPALNALMQTGTSYDRAWVGQLESETPVGHATISTGAMPKHEGLIGFEWRDPRTNQEVLDGWPKGVLAGALDRDLRISGTDSIPLAFKADDPTARIVALSSEKVYAADAMGGWAADYILYHARGTNHQLIPSAVPGHAPPADFFAAPGLHSILPMRHFTDWDYLSTMLALAAFKAFRPRALLVNLPGADVYGHPYGGPATPGVMRQVVAGLDRNIARIVKAYRDAGLYDQTLFVVTSDHGMVPNDRSIDPNDVKTVVRQAGGQYFFHTGGTAADIYLYNPSQAKAVAEAMLRVPGVAAAYYQTASNGHYQYVRAAGARISPALDFAYQYLLGTFAGPTAPDVVAPYRENTIGIKLPAAHGDHGGLNWGAQEIPLVLSGPGVRAGVVSHFPARLMDVAPTVLRLFGLQSHYMDGTILADALVAPTAEETNAQTTLARPLTGYQDALIAQSKSNIAEDIKAKALPPPSLPERP